MITSLIMKPEKNLSIAWANAFLELMKPGQQKRHPAIITIEGFDTDLAPIEDLRIRNKLDTFLIEKNLKKCQTVAGTIFPSSMWNANVENDAELLYTRYEKAWPLIKKCPANNKGVYFRRLTAYKPKNSPGGHVNQLKTVIDTFNGGNHRLSALQASIFDPTQDHSDQHIRGFPCLQQVTFTPIGKNKTELSITGFYAKQLHIEKAYGNYFGLYELGRFMAKQLGLKLTQVVCIASCLEMSELNKQDLEGLANDVRSLLPNP